MNPVTRANALFRVVKQVLTWRGLRSMDEFRRSDLGTRLPTLILASAFFSMVAAASFSYIHLRVNLSLILRIITIFNCDGCSRTLKSISRSSVESFKSTTTCIDIVERLSCTAVLYGLAGGTAYVIRAHVQAHGSLCCRALVYYSSLIVER